MSNAPGQILKDGDVIGYFEYNGTVDFAVPFVYETREDLTAHWRRDDWPTDNWWMCGHEQEPITLHSDYGGGFSWPGTWCPTCKLIHTNSVYPEDVDL